MGDVALGPADRIVLLQEAQPALQGIRPLHHGRGFESRHVAADQIEQIVDVAVFDGKLAVHVGFAQGQPRPQRQSRAGPPVMQAQREGRAGARTL